MEKKRLGKGLSALLGEYLPEEGQSDAGVQVVSVAEIAPNPLQPRSEFSAEQLAELEASIRENGLLQPLVLRPASAASPEGARWELVAGERRWRAIRRLGWSEVPALIKQIDDRTLLVLAIVENVQRADLSPLEEAAGYRRLIDEFGYTQREVAETVGRERPTVANLLRLLHLPASVQRMVGEGGLSMGHARAILGLGDERKMAALARTAAADGLSVRAVEERVRSLNNPKSAVPKKDSKSTGDAHLRHLESELQRALGTAARIRVKKGKSGTVEIPFYNPEDFERVMDLLLGVEAGRS
ncbi:MAG TPA: ParB/RepB/Spo0J family partition protein [Longimicrobiaceae bacterium]|nr:ParB/RepB/Spo0J family partition protein [Longimicrobiaceae bacterium]